jgi:hypothetical protein
MFGPTGRRRRAGERARGRRVLREERFLQAEGADTEYERPADTFDAAARLIGLVLTRGQHAP